MQFPLSYKTEHKIPSFCEVLNDKIQLDQKHDSVKKNTSNLILSIILTIIRICDIGNDFILSRSTLY